MGSDLDRLVLPGVLCFCAPPCCAATAALVRAATHPRGWSPGRHRLYHPGLRAAVRAVLLTAARLCEDATCSARAGAVASAIQLEPQPAAVLPPEIWLAVLGFARRGDWGVPVVL